MFYLVVLVVALAVPTRSSRQIFKKIDMNEDRAISESELGSWFNFQDNEYLKGNAREHFRMFDTNRDQRVSWTEYVKLAFGSTLEDVSNDVYNDRKNAQLATLGDHVQSAILVASRRWKAAGGFTMTPEEFTGFTYPELFQHMRQALVFEAVELYDANKDGKVDISELLTKKFEFDKAQIQEYKLGTLDTTEHPNILGLTDTNNNGYFDKKELGFWLMENRRIIRRREADIVFKEMDLDKNTRVSLPEFEATSHHLKWSSAGRHIREEL